MTREELENMSDDDIDNVVRAILDQEASDLSYEGRDTQIDYILNHI